MAGPTPQQAQTGYDILAQLPAGYVLTRESTDALEALWISNNYVPPSAAQILAAVEAVDGPQPAYPAGLRRFPDSNPPARAF